MFILLVYDIELIDENGRQRLNKVAKLCEKNGIRVQNSVFELNIDNTHFLKLKNNLEKIITSNDSIRFYKLGNIDKVNIEILGKKEKVEIINNENFIF